MSFELKTKDKPPGRAYHCLTTDNISKIYIFGGFSYTSNTLHDLWELNINLIIYK